MLLAIDTSTKSVGISIFDGSQFLCEESWISRRYHTVELAKAVKVNLVRAGLAAKDLQVLGVAIGPGSFTGLRIGLALVKGIAYTHQLPVIGIPTLDITARAIPVGDHLLAAVLKAGRDRLAVGMYSNQSGVWKQVGNLENMSLAELLIKIDEPCLMTGELSSELRQAIAEHKYLTAVKPTSAMRSPRYLAELAWERWKNGDVDEVLGLSPFYLHKGDPIPD